MAKKIVICIFLVVIGFGISGISRHSVVGEDEHKYIVKKEEEKKNKDVRVSFVGVGDNLLHMRINEEADAADGVKNDKKYEYKEMFKNISEDIKQADLAFINQETILGGYDLELSGYPQFNSPFDVAKDLNEIGFDIVNTATNHSLDRFQKGIQNSSSIWAKQENMITAGTYTSTKDRNTIRTIKRKGITFSFLAYTYGTNGIKPPHSYSVAYFDEAAIRKDVERAKQISDVVIVSAHWGDENVQVPSAYQKRYAQLFADLKVDVVIGTHPHVIQPVSFIKGKSGNKMPVIYSLGNALSGMLDVNNMISGMIMFDFVKHEDSKKIIIENMRWQPLITHYSGMYIEDKKDTRYNFSIYKLQEYPQSKASQHMLNGYHGQVMKLTDLYQRTERIIKEIPIVR